MTRQPLREQVVSYGAVGVTQAADLMAFPPAGFRPFERRSRIGHGDARWVHAWQATMTWGIQRGSGIRVSLQESHAEAETGTYTSIAFDEAGTPIPPETMAPDEIVYGEEGHPFITAGDTALLTVPLWPFQVRMPARVIYIVDEPKRKGFAYGTLPGHPESGEEAFLVEQTDDGSVWLTIRSFSRPSNRWWWSVYPALRLAQVVATRRYFRALSEPLG